MHPQLLESGASPWRVLFLAARGGLDLSMSAEAVHRLGGAGAPRGFVPSLIEAHARGAVRPVAYRLHLSEGETRRGRGG